MKLLLLLLASPLLAQERHAPECPDKKPPVFTGHPFKPFYCPKPGEAVPSAEAALSTTALPGTKNRDKASLKPFLGRWEGLIPYAAGRYEVLIEVVKKGGDYKVRGWVKDYHFHTKHELDAVLDAAFFKPGRFSVLLESPTVPGARLKGEAWLGSSPPPESGPALFDRELLWRLNARPEVHRLLLGESGKDRLRFIYTVLGPDGPKGRAAGELSRTSRESL